MREVLFRPLYRGEIVWNKTRKRDRWGRHHTADRSEAQWVRIPAPDLQIVPDALWTAAHDRLQLVREKYLTATSGRVYGRPRDVESKYLLPGFARCVCGGGLHVRSRSHGQRRQHFYACTSYDNKGKSVCQNGLEVRMERANDAVLASIGGQVLSPALCDAVVAGVYEAMLPANVAPEGDRLERELAGVDAECRRRVQAIATAGDIALLLDALKARQAHQQTLRAAIARLGDRSPAGRSAVERLVRARLANWRALLGQQAQVGRKLLREILTGPIQFTPVVQGERRGYSFKGEVSLPYLRA